MKVGVVMGSDSDFPVVVKALDILKAFGVKVTVRVLSAHRTPKEALAFAMGASQEGIEVMIAAAGKSAQTDKEIGKYHNRFSVYSIYPCTCKG